MQSEGDQQSIPVGPRERRKWNRPPDPGQALPVVNQELLSAECVRTRMEQELASKSVPPAPIFPHRPSEHPDRSPGQQRTGSEDASEGQRATSPSSVASGMSGRRLEWDSSADVGYTYPVSDEERLKYLTSVEKIQLRYFGLNPESTILRNTLKKIKEKSTPSSSASSTSSESVSSPQVSFNPHHYSSPMYPVTAIQPSSTAVTTSAPGSSSLVTPGSQKSGSLDTLVNPRIFQVQDLHRQKSAPPSLMDHPVVCGIGTPKSSMSSLQTVLSTVQIAQAESETSSSSQPSVSNKSNVDVMAVLVESLALIKKVLLTTSNYESYAKLKNYVLQEIESVECKYVEVQKHVQLKSPEILIENVVESSQLTTEKILLKSPTKQVDVEIALEKVAGKEPQKSASAPAVSTSLSLDSNGDGQGKVSSNPQAEEETAPKQLFSDVKQDTIPKQLSSQTPSTSTPSGEQEGQLTSRKRPEASAPMSSSTSETSGSGACADSHIRHVDKLIQDLAAWKRYTEEIRKHEKLEKKSHKSKLKRRKEVSPKKVAGASKDRQKVVARAESGEPSASQQSEAELQRFLYLSKVVEHLQQQKEKLKLSQKEKVAARDGRATSQQLVADNDVDPVSQVPPLDLGSLISSRSGGGDNQKNPQPSSSKMDKPRAPSTSTESQFGSSSEDPKSQVVSASVLNPHQRTERGVRKIKSSRAASKENAKPVEVRKAVFEIVEIPSETGLTAFSLQECLRMKNPEFIRQAEARRKVLSEIAEKREMRTQVRRTIVQGHLNDNKMPCFASLPPNPLAERRIFSQNEMLKQTKLKCRQLEEVCRRKEEKKRQRDYEINRHMAAIFARGLQRRVCTSQKVDLSNSQSVLS